MSPFLTHIIVIALHVPIGVLALRFAWNERICSMRRFRESVFEGRFGIIEDVSLTDRFGTRRDMIRGLTDDADFTFRMVKHEKSETCEFNLRVNDLYYGSWLVTESGDTKLAKLFAELKAASTHGGQ